MHNPFALIREISRYAFIRVTVGFFVPILALTLLLLTMNEFGLNIDSTNHFNIVLMMVKYFYLPMLILGSIVDLVMIKRGNKKRLN